MAFGVFVEAASDNMKFQQRAHKRVVISGHTLVLGWTDKTVFLLGELAQMVSAGPSQSPFGSVTVSTFHLRQGPE